MLKFLLKIYPAFLPILIYLFWIYVIERLILQRLLRKEKTIKGEKVAKEKIVGEKVSEGLQEAEKLGKFSLQNRHFIAVLYASFILAIATLLFSAFV